MREIAGSAAARQLQRLNAAIVAEEVSSRDTSHKITSCDTDNVPEQVSLPLLALRVNSLLCVNSVAMGDIADTP